MEQVLLEVRSGVDRNARLSHGLNTLIERIWPEEAATALATGVNKHGDAAPALPEHRHTSMARSSSDDAAAGGGVGVWPSEAAIAASDSSRAVMSLRTPQIEAATQPMSTSRLPASCSAFTSSRAPERPATMRITET